MTITAGTDTYGTLAQADAYFASMDAAIDAIWDAKTDPQKEVALRTACFYMEGVYDGRWKGNITSLDQVLAWPRAGVVDSERRAVEQTAYPERLKQAQFELTYKTLTETLSPDIDAGGLLKSKKTGPLNKEWFAGSSPKKRFEYVDKLVAPYLTSTSPSTVNLVRGL